MLVFIGEQNDYALLKCAHFFFEFPKKIKLAGLVFWVKRPI